MAARWTEPAHASQLHITGPLESPCGLRTPTPGRTKLGARDGSVVVEITLAEKRVGVSASVWPSLELFLRQLCVVIGVERVEMLCWVLLKQVPSHAERYRSPPDIR